MPHLSLGVIMWLSVPALAQTQTPACKPTYKIQYEECAHPSNGTEAKTIETEWITVNSCANDIVEGLCTDHIQDIQAKHPTAKNIRYVRMKHKQGGLKCLQKREVQCKFTMEDVVPKTAANPACGVDEVEAECREGMDKNELVKCIGQPAQTLEQKWLKAACLVDGQKLAAQIQDLDPATYENLQFQLQVLKESLSVSKSNEDLKLAVWISRQIPVRRKAF